MIALPACGRFKKARECEILAQTVSEWMAATPPPPAAAKDPAALAAEVRATARRYQDLDARLGTLEIRSSELTPRVARYRAIAQQAARSLGDVAVAVEQQNGDLARQRRVEFDTIAKEEPALVAEINTVCGR